MTLKDEVVASLTEQGAAPSAVPLWEEIYAAFEKGRPDAVWDLVEKRVRAIRSTARAQEREMKEAAGAVTRKGRPKRRR